MAAAAPALMDELIEECLLRLPPEDPANLIRAALVCKGWRRIIADRGFSCRYRDLHVRPPMLGFFHEHTRYGSCFTPTTSFRLGNADLRLGGCHAINSRHGRVLLSRLPSMPSCRRTNLAVWDPILGDHLDLPKAPLLQNPGRISFSSKAAVLCASGSGCDHLDCHCGQLIVVLLNTTCRLLDALVELVVDVHMYSSQAGTWSHVVTSAPQPQDHSITRFLPQQPVTMAGDVLYFIVHKSATNGILKYDMGAREVSWVHLPAECSSQNCRILLTTTEQGGLGIVRVEKQNSRLRLWSREAGPNGVLGWAPSGVVELETVLPANAGSISTVAFVHGLSAFFIMTNAGAFTVDLVSNLVRKVCGNSRVHYFVPYTSYCTPAMGGAFTGEGPTAGCAECMKNSTSS